MVTNKVARKKTYVLDTNVLLTSPNVLEEIRNADIVLPSVVLQELDKLKVGRGDPETRYRGRVVTRALFELSEKGNLAEGVPLLGGSSLRVVEVNSGDADLPASIRSKNADDQVLGAAYNLSKDPERHVILRTNDLNMLLKAQSLGFEVERSAEIEVKSFWSAVSRRWNSQIFPVLVIVVMVILAGFMYALVDTIGDQQTTTVAGRGIAQADQTQQLIAQYEERIANNPQDIEALVEVGVLYQSQNRWTLAAESYERAVLLNPRDPDVRTFLAIAYFNSGSQSLAIDVLNQVLSEDFNYASAHYNLGSMYYHQGRVATEAQRETDANEFYLKAQKELNILIELEPDGDFTNDAKIQLEDLERQIQG